MSYFSSGRVSKALASPAWRSSLSLPILLCSLIFLGIVLNILYGGLYLPLADVKAALTGDGGRLETIIVWDLRLPRAIIAAIAGASLGLAGHIMQTTLRNPLASPELAGVTMGSAVAVVAAIVFFPAIGAIFHPAIALIGGLLAGGFVLVVAMNTQIGSLGMILAGVAITALCSAGVMIILTGFSPVSLPAFQWLIGSVAGRGAFHLQTMLPWSIFGIALILIARRPLMLLRLGDEAARAAGVNIVFWRSVLILAAISLTSGVVAIAGAVSFIGLTAPHLARMTTRSDHEALIATPLIGAALMTFADLLAKTLASPREIPIGLFLSLLGAPILIYLIRNSRRFERQVSGSIS